MLIKIKTLEKKQMDRTKNIQNQKIYSAKLVFKRGEKEKTSNVTIKIRYAKKGKRKKEKRAFPENINKDELSWVRYHGEILSVYHRAEKKGKYSYTDSRNIIAPTNLAQKLEDIVNEVHLRDTSPSRAYATETYYK